MTIPLSTGWEVVFRLACLERRGSEFEDLFAAIMERRDAGFQRVRPWGNVGDRKNDGWSPARRILFQSYAPADYSASDLANKIENDYAGAKDYWQPYFDKWVFVHNDRDGMSPAVSLKIAELNSRSDEITCVAWGLNELREEFASLSESDRIAILGRPLSPLDFTLVDAQVLRPLIEQLGFQRPDPNGDVLPVPLEKLEANNLSADQVAWLGFGSSRAPLVERYMENAFADPSHVDGIAQAITDRYVELRDSNRPPDQIFDDLLVWVTGGALDSSILAAGLGIMAYFFERCHIFERPQVSE